MKNGEIAWRMKVIAYCCVQQVGENKQMGCKNKAVREIEKEKREN